MAQADGKHGRVLQVNVSAGGVPKRPVAEAWVDRLGLAGDAHHDDTEHGGPHRAVALYALEAIRRVQADGHPISPGSAGENLTTTGLELAGLPVGTRLAIGERLVLELSKPDNPCATIAGNFTDGRFARISIATHPLDSRMYARVLDGGPGPTGRRDHGPAAGARFDGPAPRAAGPDRVGRAARGAPPVAWAPARPATTSGSWTTGTSPRPPPRAWTIPPSTVPTACASCPTWSTG